MGHKGHRQQTDEQKAPGKQERPAAPPQRDPEHRQEKLYGVRVAKDALLVEQRVQVQVERMQVADRRDGQTVSRVLHQASGAGEFTDDIGAAC